VNIDTSPQALPKQDDVQQTRCNKAVSGEPTC